MRDDDPFHPDNWCKEPEPCRIYGDAACEVFALVDFEDYQFLLQWRWNVKRCKAEKPYLRRSVNVYRKADKAAGLRRIRTTVKSVYLHDVVITRMGVLPPSPEHTIIDHINGDSLDCRRENLRWVTPVENIRNRKNSRENYGRKD